MLTGLLSDLLRLPLPLAYAADTLITWLLILYAALLSFIQVSPFYILIAALYYLLV